MSPPVAITKPGNPAPAIGPGATAGVADSGAMNEKLKRVTVAISDAFDVIVFPL
jgi:hypothetical protein